MSENAQLDARIKDILQSLCDVINRKNNEEHIFEHVANSDFWKEFEATVANETKALLAEQEPSWTVDYRPGGHQFPDVIVTTQDDVKWGVEVKTISSDKNSWVITGGSIMETTSDTSVFPIYLICAKKSPFEMKIRRFEKCVKTVSITHSPRYILDLQLADGETIFEKVSPQTSYEKVRKMKNPFSAFRDHLTKDIENKETWWAYSSEFVSDEESSEAKFVKELEESQVRFWSEISPEERDQYVARMMVLFPKVLAPRCDYRNAVIWLFNNHIINKSFRDDFSAGGVTVFGGIEIAQKINRLHEVSDLIFDFMQAFKENDANADKILLNKYYPEAKSSFDVWTLWRLYVQNDVKYPAEQKTVLMGFVDSIGERIRENQP